MQALDWEEVEADVGKVEGGQIRSNGDTLFPAIQRPLGKILETGKMNVQKNLSAPSHGCGFSFSPCKIWVLV